MTHSRVFRKVRSYLFELFMLFCSLIVLIPLIALFLNSVKDPVESSILTLDLPKKWMFSNYMEVVEKSDIVMALFNSLFISSLSVGLIILCASLAAYIICRRSTRLSNLMYKFFFLGLIAPVCMIPMIRLIQLLQLMDTYWALVLIYTAVNIPFNVFLYTGFIKSSAPVNLDEAAIIDGCGALSVFFRIIFPLLRPVIFTSIILAFMNIWNDFQYPLYFINSSSKWTMPLTIYNFSGEFTSQWNLMCADMVLTMLPVLLVYLFAQKHIISGMVAGAIKG